MGKKLSDYVWYTVSIVAIFLVVGFLAGCKAPPLRPDAAPQPSSPAINQARLEFIGCGFTSIVGTAACYPGATIHAVTEFPGVVTYASSGSGCSLRDDVQATPPLTAIPVPTRPDGVSCAVVVIYLPTYPNKASSVPTRSLFGEVLYLPDTTYKYKGNLSITSLQTLQLQFPGAVRGAFTTRQSSDVIRFTGDTLDFKPSNTGTDVIFVRVWDDQNRDAKYVYTANYYSAAAIKLTFTTAKQKDGRYLFQFPEAVSIVTQNYKVGYDTKFYVKTSFSGIIRAYTAQGRTVIISIQNGVVQWSH